MDRQGYLLFPSAVVVGLGAGMAVTAILRAITIDDNLARTIGVGVWLLSVPTILLYASLYFADPEEIANPPKPTTGTQGWRAAKAENRMQVAEISMGIVFVLIGGPTAAMANGSNLVITIVTISCALLGGLIGYDVKRRVRLIREQFAAQNDSEAGKE